MGVVGWGCWGDLISVLLLPDATSYTPFSSTSEESPTPPHTGFPGALNDPPEFRRPLIASRLRSAVKVHTRAFVIPDAVFSVRLSYASVSDDARAIGTYFRNFFFFRPSYINTLMFLTCIRIVGTRITKAISMGHRRTHMFILTPCAEGRKFTP